MSQIVPPLCVWLKRDLRVVDHAALSAAIERAQGGDVFCVFVYEPEIFCQPEIHSRHLTFQRECLIDLEKSLQQLRIRLITRQGDAVAVLEQLRRETGFSKLFAHEETGTAISYARDQRVRHWAQTIGVRFEEFSQNGVVRRLNSRDGWNRYWESKMNQPQAIVHPLPRHCVNKTVVHLSSAGILQLSDLGYEKKQVNCQPGGEHNAGMILQDFVDHRGQFYSGRISSPVTAPKSCSRLSAHLAFGGISIRRVWQATEQKRSEVRGLAMTETNQAARKQFQRWQKSIQSMQSRLHWHCHFMQKLEDEPEVEHRNMWSAADGLRENEFSDEYFLAWKNGRTGYPLVDACMRSLNVTGWLPFRMRALVVSFASYSLWLHWRPTGLHLATCFLDFEPGIHWSQMQMQSGTTGINTLRIYNPTKQAKEQDPQGHFIRKWLPELISVPDVFIHTPWMMPAHIQQSSGCEIGSVYPKPIVDHALALRQAKSRFTVLRQAKKARDAASAVAVRHGSRRDRRGAMRQDPERKSLRIKESADQESETSRTEEQTVLPFTYE